MTKLDPKYNNPIDNKLYHLAKILNPYFHSLHFTPNGLTTLSLIFGLISCYFLYHNQFVPFALTYCISYYFDCADGAYARTYNMTSNFGDLYDHGKDTSIGILFFYILYKKYNFMKHKCLVLIMLILFLLMNMHLGCQEKMYDKNESQSLNHCKKLCPAHTKEELENIMPYTRLFGCGTLNMSLIGLVYLLK